MALSAPDPTPEPTCRACARWAALLPVLVRRHRGALVSLARAEGLAGEEALDVVQDAFVALLGYPPDPAQSPRTLRSLTRNLARNRRRLHALARPHEDDPDAVPAADAEPADAVLARAEDQERLAACVGRLADRQRAVVTLRVLDGRSGAEVAEALGLAPGHVAVLLHRAKAELAACMTLTGADHGDADR